MVGGQHSIASLRKSLEGTTLFDTNFWIKTLSLLGYPIKTEDLDIATLKEQKAIPSDVSPKRITRIYADDYIEAALVDFGEGKKLTRSACTRIARSWKANRLGIRPLLFFTNSKDSYAVIVPGKGTGGEAKVLSISDRLYRTDFEVIESMAYPASEEKLKELYDTTFFPYEKVRDEFFEGYRDLYQKTENAVRKYLKSYSTSYAQRFLGRLMFLYFLQRKGWLNNDKRFIDSIKDYKELNRLFYESLNKEGTPGIPFLNGSLFEREEYMDEEMEDRLYADMDIIFKEARDFFNQYNFTVDELASLEVDVSIDPALIGTVFENMLPEYERGSKGTFYTPRSEASFICRRALANYLTNYYPECKDEIIDRKFKDGLTSYLEKLRKSKSEKEVREFRERLLSIRMLDPAVGSGGFLLAMMQEIISLIQEAEAIVGWVSDPEEYKKKILPNLYGFDIEPEAIEIARLRLWLSLIIDQQEPEPLPNLDMNLVVIKDSLRLPNPQRTLDPEVEELIERFDEVKARYLNEHDSRRKMRLREQLNNISKRLAEKIGIDPSVIEAFMPRPADIVVMNPPYVRQEDIPTNLKDYYASVYKLDKKSDLYAYFLTRALKLVSDNGVVSVICSDKWLETGYGIALQEKLKDHLIAVYGQRTRSFGADINTVITVYSAAKQNVPIHFTYLESYAGDEVRQDLAIERNNLQPGKWFYLRAPKIFIEKILPKLTHKLSDFAEIKFGIKTGANDFFYMKDISHLYEIDYLANPKKFERWGVKSKTIRELKEQGLIYIENEGGERFVINEKDVKPLIRSPKQIKSYAVEKIQTLCFYTRNSGEYTKKYIMWGEKKEVKVKGSRKKVVGYHNLPSIKNRNPWYALPEFKPANILLSMSLMDIIYIPYSYEGVIVDHRLYGFYYKSKNVMDAWLYLNSTIFYCLLELYSRRLGGGALDTMVEDYKNMPCPNLPNLHIDFDHNKLLNRTPKKYYEEKDEETRRQLDIAVLRAMGFDDAEQLAHALGEVWKELVEDRLMKSDRPLKYDSTNQDRT